MYSRSWARVEREARVKKIPPAAVALLPLVLIPFLWPAILSSSIDSSESVVTCYSRVRSTIIVITPVPHVTPPSIKDHGRFTQPHAARGLNRRLRSVLALIVVSAGTAHAVHTHRQHNTRAHIVFSSQTILTHDLTYAAALRGSRSLRSAFLRGD